MLKKVGMLILLLLFIALPGESEDAFSLDKDYVIPGMDRSWRQGYAPVTENGVMTLLLPLSSSVAKGKITAALMMADDDVSPFRPQTFSAAFNQGADGVYRVRLELKLHKTRQNGDYPGVVKITGADAGGAPVTADIPLVIRIRDGLANSESLTPHIGGMTAALQVGEAGHIDFTLTNAGKTKEMTDILLTITDASGDILPGGTDTLQLSGLLPGETATLSYPVVVRADAAVAPHVLRFSLRYTALSQSMAWDESFTLKVSQEMRLEQGGVQMASSVIQGDIAGLTLPLMNMGRGELRNVLSTVTLDQVVDRQSVLVGSIAPGETKQAKVSFSVGKQMLGDVNGKITVTYEDAFGNAGTMELPLSLSIEAPPAVPVSAGGEAAVEEKTPALVWGLGGACGVLLIALIAQGALLRRKLHQMEEDKL